MDYRDLINAEFLRRRKTNPFYSLRSFSKDLGLSPMHLSYILRGKRGLSKQNAVKIAHAIGLRNYTAQRFLLLVSLQSGRSQVERNLAKQGLNNKKLIKEAEIELSRRLIAN